MDEYGENISVPPMSTEKSPVLTDEYENPISVPRMNTL